MSYIIEELTTELTVEQDPIRIKLVLIGYFELYWSEKKNNPTEGTLCRSYGDQTKEIYQSSDWSCISCSK